MVTAVDLALIDQGRHLMRSEPMLNVRIHSTYVLAFRRQRYPLRLKVAPEGLAHLRSASRATEFIFLRGTVVNPSLAH